MTTDRPRWGRPAASAVRPGSSVLKHLALFLAVAIGVLGSAIAAPSASGNPVPVPIGKQGAPRASPVVMPNGDEYVFFRGAYDQLQSWHWDGTAWNHQTWGATGAMTGDPSAVITTDGTVEVYVRTMSGQIGQWRITSGSSTYVAHGAAHVTGSPTAVADGSGGAEVFYRMSNGVLGRWWFNGPNWNWTQWGYATVAGNPFAVRDANGVIEVLHRTTANTMARWRFLPGGGYHDLSYAPANVGGDPSAAITGGTNNNVFYQTNTSELGRWWFNAGNWNNSVWGSSSMWTTARPWVVATPSGALDVFYRNGNSGLGRYWFSGNNWNPSSVTGGSGVLGDPAAVVNGDRVRVFFVGLDTYFWVFSYEPGGNWSSWDLIS